MKAYIVMSQMYSPPELTNIENRTEVIDASATAGNDKKKLRVLAEPFVPHSQGSCTDTSQMYTSWKRSTGVATTTHP